MLRPENRREKKKRVNHCDKVPCCTNQNSYVKISHRVGVPTELGVAVYKQKDNSIY